MPKVVAVEPGPRVPARNPARERLAALDERADAATLGGEDLPSEEACSAAGSPAGWCAPDREGGILPAGDAVVIRICSGSQRPGLLAIGVGNAQDRIVDLVAGGSLPP